MATNEWLGTPSKFGYLIIQPIYLMFKLHTW